MTFDLIIQSNNIANDVEVTSTSDSMALDILLGNIDIDLVTQDNMGSFEIAIGNLLKGDSGKSPYIDDTTKTWWEYNDTTKEYEDTGIAAKSVDIYNITNEIPLGAESFYTISTAITATPESIRKKGLILMFESSAGVWETYQFKGVIANWSVLGSWSNDLSLKIDKTAVKQVLGTSETDIMSQKAVTDELSTIEADIITNTNDIRTLENTLNSANINQETTATVTGVDIVSLPKTAANTGMQVQMFGQTAENLVVNGDFNSSSGWNTTSQGTIVNGELVVTELGGNQWTQAINANVGDKVYFGGVCYTLSGAGMYGTPFIMLLDDTSYTQISNQTATPTKLSQIRTVAGANPQIFLNAYYNGSVDHRFDKIFAINLTQTFGTGNEPTKEQCDILFANYFEGTDNVLGTGRVRSVGKNWFDFQSDLNNIKGFIHKDTGLFIANTSYQCTGYIKIKGGETYNWTYDCGGGVRGHCWYDKNKVFIASDGNLTLSLPQNAVYLRLNSAVANISDNAVLSRGIAPTTYEPYRESILQLTTPPLRSNGLIKDEIRKGANGYELVKRVGVGTSNGEIVMGGDFSDPTKWTVIGGASIISNGTLKIIAEAGIGSIIRQSRITTAGKIYRYKIDVLSLSGVAYLFIGDSLVRAINTADSGKTISGFFLSLTGGTIIYLAKELTSNVNVEFDNISIFEYNPTEGVAVAGGEAVFGGNIHYTLATPVITPIAHAGLLNSNSNGTAYFEPIIADAGVYSTNLAVQLTDYPIASFESIRKYANGTYTEINIATAVIAGDGLSFTHPDLVSGDLVMFTYAYNKESIGRSMILTHYDSRFVEADTANGKVYRIVPVITNGVVSWTAVEV